LREQLREFMALQLNDKVGAWKLQTDGNYVPVNPNPRKESSSCQDKLIKLAEKRQHEVQRLRKRKSRQGRKAHLKKT